ncbi:RDD family protein 1 [Achromobacter sp. Root83]|uniref:RDD family protein n=1 Tax=Achromobacter sp. Root83 TaxID=1736602 RepID=UPI00070978AF|nr:RDD family protein [Achromobacter sp. Root83]KRC76069.1 RDD family protein 1 [Achromobacter sp. Root83]
MQCPRCNWQNPAANKLCFSCNAPLPVKAAKAPVQRAAKTGTARVFPSIWPRLGATAIDAIFMAVATAGLAMAASYTYQGLTGEAGPVLLAIAAGLIGWLLPAFMDAWGSGSPGKRLLKMRVVTRKGGSPGLLRSVWRHILKYTLNVVLPGIFHHIQQTIFGERAMHNSLAGTHVVSSHADPRAVLPAVAQTRAVTGAGRFLFVVFGVAALVLVGMVIGVIALDKDEGDNPLRTEVIHLDLVSDPVRMLAEGYYQRTRTFAPDMAALGVTQESLKTSGFSKLEMNPVNGVLRFTIAGEPATADAPSLGGKHLVYLPELRSEKKGGGVRRWQCGSDDIPRADRPYSCRHEAGALAR